MAGCGFSMDAIAGLPDRSHPGIDRRYPGNRPVPDPAMKQIACTPVIAREVTYLASPGGRD
jgi:hypothetical protein